MRKILAVGLVLIVAALACGEPAPEYVLRGWTVTPSPFLPTQTERVVVHTTTPVYTYTPIVKVITETPRPPAGKLCVSATVAVHLRPTASTENYPITVLANGTVLDDLRGRDGKWLFVRHGEKRGWVDGNFVKECEKTE